MFTFLIRGKTKLGRDVKQNVYTFFQLVVSAISPLKDNIMTDIWSLCGWQFKGKVAKWKFLSLDAKAYLVHICYADNLQETPDNFQDSLDNVMEPHILQDPPDNLQAP